jgi:hypothetical protein
MHIKRPTTTTTTTTATPGSPEAALAAVQASTGTQAAFQLSLGGTDFMFARMTETIPFVAGAGTYSAMVSARPWA